MLNNGKFSAGIRSRRAAGVLRPHAGVMDDGFSVRVDLMERRRQAHD